MKIISFYFLEQTPELAQPTQIMEHLETTNIITLNRKKHVSDNQQLCEL